MVNEDVRKSVIIDNGSGSIKAGFSGEDVPSVIIPNAVGYKNIGPSTKPEIGTKAISGSNSNIKYPMEHGQVVNWDDMECVWGHVLETELKVNPQEYTILLTEAPLNPAGDREKMGQIFFEKFGTPALFTAIPAVLALYSTGRKTGLVVDAGDGVTCSVPVVDGYAVPGAIKRRNFGGRDVTNYLSTLLYQKYRLAFASTKELEIVREIKEKLSSDVNEEDPFNFKLPDGRHISIGREQPVLETMFNPALVNQSGQLGIDEMVMESVENCEASVRKSLFSNIVTTGGNTMLPGFQSRLQTQITNLIPEGMDFKKVITAGSGQPMYGAWNGGSILTQLSAFEQMWVSKQKYEEVGASVLCH